MVALILGGRFIGSATLWPLSIVLLPLSILGFLSVIRLERRSANPVLNLELFTKRTFAIACASMILFSLVAGANTFLFPFYMQKGVLWSVAYTSTILVSMNILPPFISPLSGSFADRIGSRPIQMAGVAVTFCGLIVASQLGASPAASMVVATLLIISLGSALFNPANGRIIYGEVPRTALGTASAISTSGRYIGQSFGAAFGALLLASSGDGAVVEGFSRAMAVLAAVIVVGMALIWTAGRFGPMLTRGRGPLVEAEAGPGAGGS
jgi:MFS family permease